MWVLLTAQCKHSLAISTLNNLNIKILAMFYKQLLIRLVNYTKTYPYEISAILKENSIKAKK